MLVVPLGVLGSLLAATMRGMPNDVYFKVGLLAIIGLSTKNAILIVEFAKDLQKEGKGLVEATLEAVHLRLRPILMTSLAFILGVTPLALSTGAGSASQHAIGTGVAGGMFTATFLAIFLVPVFYVAIRRIFMPKDTRKSKMSKLYFFHIFVFGTVQDAPLFPRIIVRHCRCRPNFPILIPKASGG